MLGGGDVDFGDAKRSAATSFLLKLGTTKKDAGRASGSVYIQMPTAATPITAATFTFTMNRKKLHLIELSPELNHN